MYFARDFRLLIYGPQMINVLAKPIEESDFDDIPRLRQYMVECMRRRIGVGLSAPQISLFKQFVVIEGTANKIVDLVNPVITKMYGKETEELESCISIPPDQNGCLVPRLETVHVEASTARFPELRQEFVFHGKESRIVQHELDHLFGTFFVDRTTLKNKQKVLEKFEYWKQMRRAQIHYAEKGSGNVDAGTVASRGGKSRLS